MADIQSARFGRYLQNLFNLKQRATLGEILPDAIPTVELDKPRAEQELFLGNDLCAGTDEVTAAAGEFPQVSIGFPSVPSPQLPGSLVVIERIFLESIAGTPLVVSCSFGSVSTHTASASLMSKLDTRRYLQAPAAVVRHNSIAAVPQAFARFALAGSTSKRMHMIPGPIVLCPIPGVFERAGFIVTGESLVSTLRATFWWRERQVRADELIV